MSYKSKEAGKGDKSRITDFEKYWNAPIWNNLGKDNSPICDKCGDKMYYTEKAVYTCPLKWIYKCRCGYEKAIEDSENLFE